MIRIVFNKSGFSRKNTGMSSVVWRLTSSIEYVIVGELKKKTEFIKKTTEIYAGKLEWREGNLQSCTGHYFSMGLIALGARIFLFMDSA